MSMDTIEIPVEDTRDRRPFGLTPTSVEICLLTASRDRVLVEDTIAKMDLPPIKASAADGFCIVFADVRYASPEAHVRLNIVNDIPAGSWRADSLAREKVARMVTGAPILIRCTMSGKMFKGSLTGSQDSMLSSRDCGNVLSPNPAGEMKLTADELVEV